MKNDPQQFATKIISTIAVVVMAGVVTALQAWALQAIILWFNGPSLAFWQSCVIMVLVQSIISRFDVNDDY